MHWEKLGTHEPHLSVIDFKKKERAKEVIALEEQVNKIESKLIELKKDEEYISLNVTTYYEDKEWEIPSPKPMMNARTYRERIVHPFVMKLKAVIKKVILDYLKLRRAYESLNKYVSQLKKEVKSVNNLFERAMYDNAKLAEKAENFDCVKKTIGDKKVSEILKEAKAQKVDYKKIVKEINYER